MRRARITVVAACACAALTVVAGATGPIALITVPQDQVQALSGLDVPITGERGKELIESTFCPPPGGCAAGQPVTDLIALARDIEADPGVRLRAYRAIGLYPGAAAQNALRADLLALASAQPGTEQLYLRAAIEALGEVGDSVEDVPNLVPFLDYEPSRDIRAATADALRQLGCACAAAIDPLQARLTIEQLPDGSRQVEYAITRALRALNP
jgi:hypothetical protein